MPSIKKRRLSQSLNQKGKQCNSEQPGTGDLSKVHVCSCFPPQPSGVTYLSFEETSQTLCVARVNGSLEFYRLVTLNSLVQTEQDQELSASKRSFQSRKSSPLYHFHFLKASPSVDGWYASRIVWINPNRLLTAGLSSAIVEWDLTQLIPKGTATSSYGGAVWDLVRDPSKPIFAAACDDGQGRVFEVDSETQELTLRCALGKKPGARATSVLFSKYGPQPSGSLLFLGHDTSIVSCHIWGTREEKWNTALTNRWSDEEHVIVWCMVELPTNRIVVGTSNGDVQFINITNGIKLNLITTHAADILTMAYVPDVTDTLYVSGCDHRLIRLTQNSVYDPSSKRRNQKEHWGETLHMTSHRCDVTSLICVNLSSENSDDKEDRKHTADQTTSDESRIGKNMLLISGSLDCTVNLYRHVSLSRLFYEQFEGCGYIQSSIRQATLSSLKRDLLLNPAGTVLQLWSIGVTPASEAVDLQQQPNSVPTLLLEFQVQGRYHIVSSDISSDGQWVAYATATRVSVLQLTCTMKPKEDERPSPKRARKQQSCVSSESADLHADALQYENQAVLKQLGGVRILRFSRSVSSSYHHLFMIDSFNRLCLLSLETQNKNSVVLPDEFLSEPATLLEQSNCFEQGNQLVCAGNRCSTLMLYQTSTSGGDCKIKEYGKLPRFYHHIVGITFLPFPNTQMLLITGLVEACVWNIHQRHLQWKIQLGGPQTLPFKDKDSDVWSRPENLLLGATAVAHLVGSENRCDIAFYSQSSVDMVTLTEDMCATSNDPLLPPKTIVLQKVSQSNTATGGEENAATTTEATAVEWVHSTKPTYLNLLNLANKASSNPPESSPSSKFLTSGLTKRGSEETPLPLCISRRFPVCDDTSAVLAIIWLSDGNLLVSTIYKKLHWAVIPNCVWRRRYAT